MIPATRQAYFTNQTLPGFTKSIASFICTLCISTNTQAKEVIGWVENVGVTQTNTIVKAKIDTGADSSSINSESSTVYKRDGKSRIKFSVTDNHGKSILFDEKIIRWVRVKRHYGEMQRRPLIRLGLCIGNLYKETYVSLIDRSEFNYNLLIGRDFLKGNFTVDPSLTFTTKPECVKKLITDHE